MVLIRIKTKREIFGCDEFPITFPDYHTLCHWLRTRDNYCYIEKILSITDHYLVH